MVHLSELLTAHDLIFLDVRGGPLLQLGFQHGHEGLRAALAVGQVLGYHVINLIQDVFQCCIGFLEGTRQDEEGLRCVRGIYYLGSKPLIFLRLLLLTTDIRDH